MLGIQLRARQVLYRTAISQSMILLIFFFLVLLGSSGLLGSGRPRKPANREKTEDKGTKLACVLLDHSSGSLHFRKGSTSRKNQNENSSLKNLCDNFMKEMQILKSTVNNAYLHSPRRGKWTGPTQLH